MHHRNLVGVDGAVCFGVAEFNQQRRTVERNFQFFRSQQYLSIDFLDTPLGSVPSGLRDGPGVIALRQPRSKGSADADEIGSEYLKPDLRMVAATD